jgi:LysM repeat protein
VRPGQSFGSIAAKTGINILTLEQLNPRLKPATLWPGDRLRLRPPLLASSSLALLSDGSLPVTLSW